MALMGLRLKEVYRVKGAIAHHGQSLISMIALFLFVVQMYTLQELCLDCTGANASCFQVCEIEGMYYINVSTQSQ